MKTILRGLVGSTVHGLNVQDAVEDRDEMGVCIEPIERVAGLHEFEQHICRTAAEREGTHNARSKAGDLDLVIYGLRKYVRLALRGNPTILTLLFVPVTDIVEVTPQGMADTGFVSRPALPSGIRQRVISSSGKSVK